MSSSPYLAIAAIVKNEARHIQEWIAFHQLVGVEHFFIYDNGSTDDTAAILHRTPGVTVYDWPGEKQQLYAYANALLHWEPTWLAFLDADEYLFSSSYKPLPAVLRRYERYDAVGACWAMYGTSGHAKPRDSVVGSYTRRARFGAEVHRHVKSIVQPERIRQQVPADPHHFPDCFAVDTLQRRLDGPFAQSVTWEHLRINHYVSKSVEEAKAKMLTPRADNAMLRTGSDLTGAWLNAVEDDVLVPYAELVDARLTYA